MNSEIKNLVRTAKRFGGSTTKTEHKVILTLREKSTQTFFFPSRNDAYGFTLSAISANPAITDYLIVSDLDTRTLNNFRIESGGNNQNNSLLPVPMKYVFNLHR